MMFQYRLFCLLILLLVCPGIGPARAADQETKEFQVKAALIYNIAGATNLPAESMPSASSPFTICVIGKGPLGAALGSLRDKIIKGRKIAIKTISRVDDLGEAQMLVLDDLDPRVAKRVIDSLYVLDQKVVTVSDMPKFTQIGGMVALYKHGGTVKIEINKKEATQSKISFSQQLLNLAKITE